MSNPFEHKIVAVMNKSVEPGKLMNALGHISFGLGGLVDNAKARFSDYTDADNSTHPNISDMPFIVCRANSNKIRQLRQNAKESDIQFVNFTETMTIGTHVEQKERTAQTPEQDLQYYGIVLFGEWDKVSELTKKFSLWR